MNHRYLVISELFLPTKGGTAVWFDEVYRRIGGKEIHIVTADVPGAAEHDRSHVNTIHRVSLRRHPWLRPESLAIYLKLFGKALGLALTHRFDAVHAGRVLPEGLVAWILARLRGLPCVIYAHGEEITTWRQLTKFKAMRFTYRHADQIVANSEFTRGELLKLGVHPDRIEIIHPGVDIARFRPGLAGGDLRARIGLGGEQKLVLSIGRLSRRKGLDQVVKSLPDLLVSGLDVHYAIVGIGEDQDYLNSLAREFGVAERVHFLGHVPAEELPLWLNAADVFAMPNREIDGDNEGFGIVFLEAAACAKPVIAGRDGGTGAAVVDGETGFRVDGASLKAVTDALRTVLSDSELSHRLGHIGYERAVAEFTWQRVAQRTVQLQRSLGSNRAIPNARHRTKG